MKTADLLVEIGTEELPPKALRSLMEAFAENLASQVDEARLARGDVHAYASPRRLAVRIDALAAAQADRTVEQKGPPVAIAFDDDGKPKPPAIAFAKKLGVDVEKLERTSTDKGEWLSYRQNEKGKTTAELIPGLVENALAALPIPRRMRWGAGDAEFVRPVHWVVLLHGDEIIDAEIMGLKTGRDSRGHRFHSGGPVTIDSPGTYLERLESEGRVIADFSRRREMIEKAASAVAAKAGGVIVDGESLFDEVAALVEWPVPVLGNFDETFLELPREVVVSTLTGHQRYFPVADAAGKLLPKFVTISNLESRDPDQVRDGNERVIRPRLADAAFFWDSDRKTKLANREEALRDVVYQRGLGTLYDKSERTATLAAQLAGDLDVPADAVSRAAMLAKCDLLTGMVGEFPELQGTMGQYYASADGESDEIAVAIGEHYRPRFAGDALPSTVDGQLLAVADKLDTIAGVFALGKKPSGNRDPFALRRAALGIVRILVECELDINLAEAIRLAVEAQPASKDTVEVLSNEVYDFIVERLRRYLMDRDAGLATDTFEAVLQRRPVSLVDYCRRISAVQAFLELDEAESLAAANKRIDNILKKSGADLAGGVSEKAFAEPAETELFGALGQVSGEVAPLIVAGDYAAALKLLAALKGPVDKFFDDVLVMADDVKLKQNRLALLNDVRELFLNIADISRLSIDQA